MEDACGSESGLCREQAFNGNGWLRNAQADVRLRGEVRPIAASPLWRSDRHVADIHRSACWSAGVDPNLTYLSSKNATPKLDFGHLRGIASGFDQGVEC